jgi:putative ATP-binding cassette transporter
LIVENFESLSRFAAGIDRLDTLARALESEPGAGPSERRIRSSDGSTLAARHVTVETPQGEQTLVTDLNFELPTGGGLLILGPSGCGKSSLLRAISGLWNSGEGEIQRPPDIDTLFLPQRPYMQIGSLRSQLLYPRPNRDVDDAHLAEALEAAAGRPGGALRWARSELDWSRVLSIGEQQRLAFARLLLINPRVAILDEATSALDSANEAVLYRRLRERNTTIVSIAHRESLLTYHTQVLELTGDGGWRLLTPDEFRRRNDVDTPAPAVVVV